MSNLDIRKTEDGKIQARRKDGLPLTAADRLAAKETIAEVSIPPSAWLVEQVRSPSTGKLLASKIRSGPLESHLWLLHDQGFVPPDSEAIFYESELEFLKDKPVAELKRFLEYKVIFPRSRIVQDSPS